MSQEQKNKIFSVKVVCSLCTITFSISILCYVLNKEDNNIFNFNGNFLNGDFSGEVLFILFSKHFYRTHYDPTNSLNTDKIVSPEPLFRRHRLAGELEDRCLAILCPPDDISARRRLSLNNR